MAAYYGHAIGRSSLSGGSRLEQSLLPNGACSYRDLNAGVKAPTCGCRRFWLNKSQVANQENERAWCFCGHHACFHENIPPSPSAHGQTSLQDAEITANTFSSSHQFNGASQTGGFVAPTWSSLIGEHDHTHAGNARPATARPATGLGIQDPSQPPADSINNRLWHALNGFARYQEDGRQSGGTSRLPSTAVPSVYDDPGRTSPTQMLREHVQQSHLMGPPVTIPPINVVEARADDYSATEVATPSVRGTPDLRAAALAWPQIGASPAQRSNSLPLPSARQAIGNPPSEVRKASEQTPPPTATMGPSLSIQEMCNTIQNYGRRLSILEGVSFSHMPSEEVQHNFDLQDSRLIDLETWRTEQDQAQAADDTDDRMEGIGRRIEELESWRSEQDRSKTSQETEESVEQHTKVKRPLIPETSSLASDGSFDENAAAQTEAVVLATLAANAETGPRIDALESRIWNLENLAMPSVARPWHISVVVLPFGRQLPGIWFSANESTQHSIRSATQASEEWPGHQSLLKSSFHSATSSGAWTTESIEAWSKQTADEWLSPKACGPSGTVFQRLASRGLVRDVVLQAPDARHIITAICGAFGDVIRQERSSENGLIEQYQGLQERFIPLRKIRKSTRLRFLNPAEMVTSATWNAEFLEASVFMKVNDGERRLYLTTPDGYTQPSRLGWSWPGLRNLPAFDVDGVVQEAQIDGDIVEACWTYNDRLDHSASLNSSFASSHEESGWGVSDGEGTAEIKNDVPMLSPTATRHSRMRSASLPSSAVEVEAAPKRRVASFELEPTAGVLEYSPENISKRRRISSNSPELERRGVNFTPRWSREPPSPYMTEDIGHLRSSQATNRARGTTPFAYATPHSHFDSRGGDGDGDTEVDDVMTVAIAPSDEEDDAEEWQGVQDGLDSEYLPKTTSMQIDDADRDYLDEDNLEDGLSIYEA